MGSYFILRRTQPWVDTNICQNEAPIVINFFLFMGWILSKKSHPNSFTLDMDHF